MSFVERLKKERVDGKPVVGVGARWHERFLKLLENGHFFVHYDAYDKVAEVLGIEATDPQKARQKVSQLVRKLSELGLYEAVGTGEYRLNPYILAHALGIDRLPDGSTADIEEVLRKVKNTVIRAREKQRERLERRRKQAAEAQG
jgi:beta-phosphoglucomutase-like phosphatase (HAD superfamily)